MKKRPAIHIVLILIFALLLGFFDLPSDTQKTLIPPAIQNIEVPFWGVAGSPNNASLGSVFLNNQINLGLDLQGGSQLDYKVDLRKVAEPDKKSVIDGILATMNRRVNSLGVSEPNIYTSTVGDETHVVVELAGIKDLEKAKEIVGKTIQLEFKKQAETQEDPNLEAEVRSQAQAMLNKALAGEDLSILGQGEAQVNPTQIGYFESPDFVFKDAISGNLADPIFTLEAGQTLDRLIDNSGNITLNASGQLVSAPAGFHLVKVTEKRDQERTIDSPRSVKVRHVLVAYAGAQRAGEEITRTEEEAQARAQEVLTKLNEGGDFIALAKEYSDDTGSKEDGGLLPDPVVAGEGNYVKEFEDAGIAFTEPGQLSEIVKSPFGFHILKAEEIQEATTETKMEPQVKYIDVYFSAAPDPWESTELNGLHFTRADVQFTQTLQPYILISFDAEGSKMFENLTRESVGKPIAIFVGGQLVSAPTVNEVIAGGQAQITGQFTVQEATDLARDLNTGAIPAPITLAGQYTIGATLGQDALQKSLFAGVIGFILVVIFMIFYYRLPGVLAAIALTIYSLLLLFLIKATLPLPWALAISVAVFIYLIMAILKARDDGAEKSISTILVCFILFFLTFLLSTPVVMTLAGIAGVILSIGMAVDANILIFERMKEELSEGRTLDSAIDVGFRRAWSSIRDSNFSSLITCGILFYFGSSIIQGFAFNLAAGILVSMFTAITMTRTFMLVCSKNSALSKNLGLWVAGFGAKAGSKAGHSDSASANRKLWKIVQKRKTLYWLSGTLVALSLIGTPFIGLKLGLDFTGGTLMEFSFPAPAEGAEAEMGTEAKAPVTADDIRSALVANQETVNEEQTKEVETGTDSGNAATDADSSPAEGTGEALTATAAAKPVELENALIVPSENGFIVKTQHITAAAHDVLIEKLHETLGDFEETRFSTVGPTVGASLQQKAVFAVIFAALMIVLYIAFAFRRVPKHIGKWRFGLAAIAALVHDLLIMLGLYIYLGAFFGVEVDALFITAMLTVLGFSVHDTIVVFDRIREKLKHQKRDETFEDVANQAVNDTLARSFNTTITVLFTLVTLAIFGSESIRWFTISLVIGIVAGTYSSIFVATPLLVDWQNKIRTRRK